MFRSHFAKISNNLIPGISFSLSGEKQAVYLTFDDGPNPETTPRILELLAKHDAKATFFCLGLNVEKYPAAYDSILAEGHAIGNHSWSHPNGWLTGTRKYLENIERASEMIRSNLFRPPYGRITPGQYLRLRKKYEIIMWTRQFADYRKNFDPAVSSLSGIHPGDILVMHDSVKTSAPTLRILSRLLELHKEIPSIKAYNVLTSG